MKIAWLEAEKLCAGGIPLGTSDIQSLLEQGVGAIVTLTEHPLSAQKELDAETLSRLGLRLLHLSIPDQKAPTDEQARALHDFITAMNAENRAVFVHCHAGVGRTGTALHAHYLLGGMTLSEAKAHIKQRRPTTQYLMLSQVQTVFLERLAAELDLYR
jgi:atypical dual specificity phosphatase